MFLLTIIVVSGFVGIRTSRAQITDTQQTTTAAKEGTTATAATSAAPAYTIGEVSPNVVNKNKEYSFYAKTDISPLTKDLKCAFIPNEDDPKNMITVTLGSDGKLTAPYAYPNTGNSIAFFACEYNVTSKASVRVLGPETSKIVKSFIGGLIDTIIDAITPPTPPTPPSPEPSPAPVVTEPGAATSKPTAPKLELNCPEIFEKYNKYKENPKQQIKKIKMISFFSALLKCFRI